MMESVTKTMRRGGVLLLAIALVIGLMPVMPAVALADGSQSRIGDATPSETSVASVLDADGQTEYYESVSKAFSDASDGSVITLLRDIAIDEPIEVATRVTLVIDGHVVTNNVEKERAFIVTGSSFTVDGTADGSKMVIPEANGGSYGFIKVAAPSVVTLNGGEYSGNTDNGAFVKVFRDDAIDASGSSVIFNACTMESNGAFFDTNTLSTDVNTPTLQVTGGMYSSEGKAFGMDTLYRSPVTFTNVTVTAGTGPCVEVCGPGATFTNCTFTVTGKNSNGFGTTAVATSWSGSATIDGGTYSAPNGYGMYVYNSGGIITVNSGTVSGGVAAVKADKNVESDEGSTQPSTVIINGGTTQGDWQTNDKTNAPLVAAGGIHTANVSEYLDEGVEMATVETSQGNVVYGVVPDSDVASCGDVKYSTLSEAISAAGGQNATITLLADTYEDVVIPADVNVTIDLAGHTLTNVKDDTITNNGTLTIIDSSENRTGTVDNLTHGKAALWNEVGATATLNAGTFIRSMENGISSTNNGGNSYYAILNHGTMAINDGVSVVQDGNYSSLLENGWQDGGQNTGSILSKLTINGGTFSGGLNTIKNDDWGELTINGGTFENTAQAAVLNWNVAVINDGTFTSNSRVVLNGSLDDIKDKGSLVINGGTFTPSGEAEVIEQMGGSGSAGNVSITGGTFEGPVADDNIRAESFVITGGDYVESPAAFMHDDFVAKVENGEYKVMPRSGLQPGTYVLPEGADPLSQEDFAENVVISVDRDTGEVTATRPYIPPANPSYDATVEQPENGTVELSDDSAKEGDEVTITATPDLGYEVGSVTVTSGGEAVEVADNGDGTWTFTMPKGDVEISVEFADAWENPFTDVSEGAWYYGAIRQANLLGLMSGIGGTTLFDPDGELTREQAATVMWNALAQGDEDAPAAQLSDVDQSQWYAPYVNWAVASGVMLGYGGTDEFGVGDALTREQFAMVIANAVDADVASADPSALEGFSDAAEVDSWAVQAMAWAVENGVINGVEQDDGFFELQAARDITRAEMATMIVNAVDAGALEIA